MNIRIILLVIFLFLTPGCLHRPRHAWSSKPAQPHEFGAISNFKKSKGNDSASFYQSLGIEYIQQNNLIRAKTCFLNAVKLDDKLYLPWFYLGLIDIDSPAGYSYLKRSSELKPDFAISYYWMAYYHCRLYENQEATVLFKKYLKLAKNLSGEKYRLVLVNQVLEELASGKEGEILKEIRKPLK